MKREHLAAMAWRGNVLIVLGSAGEVSGKGLDAGVFSRRVLQGNPVEKGLLAKTYGQAHHRDPVLEQELIWNIAGAIYNNTRVLVFIGNEALQVHIVALLVGYLAFGGKYLKNLGGFGRYGYAHEPGWMSQQLWYCRPCCRECL